MKTAIAEDSVTKFGRDNIKVQIGSQPEEQFYSPDNETPFHILLIGDWGGNGQKISGGPLAERRPVAIDRDDFDAVLRRMDVSIPIGGQRYPIRDIDDFHPDSLYRKLPIFETIRNRPEQPKSAPSPATPPAASPAVRAASGSGSLLDALLDASDAGAATARSPLRPEDDLQSFVSRVVRPHLEPREDPHQVELERESEALASRAMRALLRSEEFRSIEAAWRSVYQIVRTLETGPDLRVSLLQATKEEIASDANGLLELLTESSPWSVIAANFSIGPDELPLLTALGRIGKEIGAPFVAEADPSLPSAGEEWQHFRGSPEAAWVGLALPRILLRLPYGAKTSACEAFPFEEIDGEPHAGHLLFGNPALFCAMLLGQSFTEEGWAMRPRAVRDIRNLPVYTWRNEHEVITFPCAELTLSERTAESLLENGFIPVIAPRAADYVRILRFQSAAEPPGLLRGRWN